MQIQTVAPKTSRLAAAVAATIAILLPSLISPPAVSATNRLTLNEAISRAIAFAPSVAAAAAASDLGRAALGEARAPLYPSIDTGLVYYRTTGYSTAITNDGETAAQATLNYTAYDFGRRLAVMRAARYAAEAARLGLTASQNQIVFDTSVAYFDLVRTQREVAEWRANRDQLNRYLGVIQELERSGQAITSDVLRIHSERDSVELQLATADQARRKAAIVLGSFIGEYDDNVEAEDLTSLPAPPEGDIQRNPILRADQRNIDSATLAVKAAEAERYPNLGMQLTTGFLGIDAPHTFNNNFGASYQGVVGMPIFDGGLIRSHIDAARARRMAAIAQRRQDELVLSQRLADARMRYNEARRQLAILARSIPVAHDSFALDWTRFLGGGSATLLEVIDALRQLQTFQITQLDEEFAARQAAAEVALVLGVR